jgi:hypothetical protein
MLQVRMMDERAYYSYIVLLTFLLTKHFIDYDNVFLKDYSYSKSAVCSAPALLKRLIFIRKSSLSFLKGESLTSLIT